MGCSYMGDKIAKGTPAKASSRFAASKSLSVPASQAHLSPQHLNMFLLDELPSPTQRINYQIEVARSLYAGGQKERSRQVMAHAWRTAAPFMDMRDSYSENVQNFISGAFYTGNKSILRKCEVLDGGFLSEMLGDYVGPHAQAINLVLGGNIKEGQTTLVECVANGRAINGVPNYGDLDYVIRSLNQAGRKGAAKALLAPYYWHWFPPKEKTQGTGNAREKDSVAVPALPALGNQAVGAAAVSPLQDMGPFNAASDFCRFIETYSLVHGAKKAEPLVRKALELASTFKLEELGQVVPSRLERGLKSDTVRTYHVLQEVAGGAEAVAGFADLDIIHLSRLLASAGHDAEARRLADAFSSFLKSLQQSENTNEDSFRSVEMLAWLAEAYQRLGDKDKAVSALDEATELYLAMDIVDHMGLSRIAVLYARLGEEQKAMETFNQCLRSFSSIKKQASGLAMAASVGINSGELSRELRDLSASLRVKLADKNKDALQYVVFDMLGPDLFEVQPLYEVNGFLMEMVGWLSCDNYYDDWEYRGSFSRIEQSMARELVRVVMGGEPAVKKQPNLDGLLGKGTQKKNLPPWLSSVPPDAGMLLTYDISSVFKLFESIPDETLQQMVSSDPSIPEWAAPLVAGPVIKFMKGARLDQEGQSALGSVLKFVPDEYKAEAQLAVDFLGGNVGLSDHPVGFWMELLPAAKEDENASASEREVLLVGAIPIKGGDRITEWLGKSVALKEAGIILTKLGKYSVVESAQLAELGDLLDVPVEGMEDVPYVIGIKEDQIVVLGMAQLKMEVGPEGGPILTEFMGGAETVKGYFWRKFSNPEAVEYKPAPRFKQILSKPAMVNAYFSLFGFMEMILSAWEDQPLEAAQLDMLRQVQQTWKSDAEEVNAAFGFSFNFAPEGFMFDMVFHQDKWKEGRKPMQKPIPAALSRLLGDYSSVVGSYSLGVDEIQNQIMEQLLMQANLQLPSGQKLDAGAMMAQLDEEFQRQNGIKLSSVLDNIPESVLFVGPDMNQRLSEIGVSMPSLVLGVKLRNKDQKISQLFDLIEKQGGLPEEVDIEELLSRIGFHAIEKDGYIYLCSGKYKSSIEQGRLLDRRSTRPDVERMIKEHGGSMVIDGELLAGIAQMGGFDSGEDPELQKAVMAIIDKMFVAAYEGENGDSGFRMGASFKPEGWSRIMKTMAAQALAEVDNKSGFTLIPGRTDSVERRYDKPVAEVMAAVRIALQSMGTITGEEAAKNVITARINTNYVWVKVTPDKQAPEAISAVRFQVRTKSSRPDLQTASAIAEQTTLALISAANLQPK
jgi:tetratricopeptide (TPR) repeat protein